MDVGEASTVPPARRRGLLAAAPALMLVLLAPAPALAQEVDGFVELTGARSDQKTEVNGGLAQEIESSSLFQRYSLNFTWTPYPHLRLAVGGLFERDDLLDSSSDASPDITRETLRPYFDLALGSGVFSAEMAFYRLEDRARIDNFQARDIRDNLSATLTWRPADLPEWRLTMLRTDSHDADRESLDLVDTLVDLRFDYTPIRTVDIYYRGGVQTSENRIDDVDFTLTSHAGRLTYGNTFWNRRLVLGGEYNGNYQKRTFDSTGNGEIISPVLAADGISANDDFPLNVTLAPNAALSDGNRAASAGVNLGLPPPGGDTSLRNIGLDLTVPTNVDTLHIWVDRLLPPEISGSFVWQIYTSADNQAWALQGTASSVFGPLDPRFELRFNDLAARYIKVVTSPLDLTNPSATQFPLILVTEIEAFDRTPASDAPDQEGVSTHRLNANLRVKLLPNRSFFYDVAYSTVRPDLRAATWVLSNALSYNQQVNRVLGVSARVARDEGRESGGNFVSYPYTASARATWLDTLRQSLVFSGVRTESEQSDAAFDSVFLQTSADLYRGISAELGLGTSRRTDDGVATDMDQLTASATFLPHPTVSMNVLYQLRRTDRPASTSGAGLQSDFEAGEVSLSLRPFPSLYLFGSYRREFQDLVPDRKLVDYNIGWTPFPSGSLQITLRYDETYRSELDTESAVTSASIRWNIRRGRYVEASYVHQKASTALDRREFNAVQASLRWPF